MRSILSASPVPYEPPLLFSLPLFSSSSQTHHHKSKYSLIPESVPKPRILEPRDVTIKVTGSSVCGSDLHLLHGAIVQLQKGDILGHEFCGVIESVGPEIKTLKPGDRVVASFHIACGECDYCMRKLSSQCERTNSNTLAKGMYGTQPA
jgi:threonine dehydrogenase-like Zn-dependent dehydrogenase